MPSSHHALLLLVAAGFTLLPAPAEAAFCIANYHYYHFVGNRASDPLCTEDDIQTAIDNTSCPDTTIVVTQEQTYNAQHLVISGKTFTMAAAGSGVGCGVNPAMSTTPQITLDGTGNGGKNVIDISGDSNVTLQYFKITGGNPGTAGYGGGINFNGTGSLTLDADTIDGNAAGYGAGVTVNGNGGGATLTLKNFTLILNNTAEHDGGGVRVEGNARLFMLEAASTIAFNHANSGYGGGIEVLGPARIDIGSSGVVLGGAISDNTAANGGGAALIATPTGNAYARLFTVDPAQPVLVSQNSASSSGGAFYLRPRGPYYGPIESAALCAWEFRIDDNTAAAGAAIYNDLSPDDNQTHGDSVLFNQAGDCDGPESIATLGAVACASTASCNEVSGNAAVNALNQATGGSVIELKNYNALALDRFAMRGNSATRLVDADSSLQTNGISNCLFADNHTVHELLAATFAKYDPGSFTVDNCTLANNVIDNGYVFYANNQFTLTHSIVAEEGLQSIDYGGGCCLNASYTISNDITTFPGDAGFVLQVDDPLFVDATNPNVDKRDYHLRAYLQSGNVVASPAIDYAPPLPGDDRDLDGNPHDQDVPAVPNYQGDRDLGCYEAQPILDRVFGDGFGDPTSLVY